MYDYLIVSEAFVHIAEGESWYHTINPVLGTRFMFSLEATLNYIRRNPFAYQIKYNELRMGKLKRFPYGIFYYMDDSIIIVVGVLMFEQDPKTFHNLSKKK